MATPPKPRPKLPPPEGIEPWWRELTPRERRSIVSGYPEHLRADYEERAAILEANGLHRDQAEADALEALVIARIVRDRDEANRLASEVESRNLSRK